MCIAPLWNKDYLALHSPPKKENEIQLHQGEGWAGVENKDMVNSMMTIPHGKDFPQYLFINIYEIITFCV